MSVRAVIATLVVVISSHGEAASSDARQPWHAVVSSSRTGLPSVAIDFGYPGPYVPMLNAPITIHATAADVPFDGYIGYHFAVGDWKTLDTPVISRAKLRPHESWSFTTVATLRRWTGRSSPLPREIVIEWHDRSMRLIASHSAGVPSWTLLQPLRIVASDARASDEVLGSKPYVERVDALPDRAQWYAGFSAVVIPVAAWLDLPPRIREAIFASGVNVVFFGLPRQEQQLGHLDQTLLPVAFVARPGSYVAPWPYRNSRPIAMPMSWTAREGADRVGPDQNPYIVRTDAAAWVADEAAVARPLPSMARALQSFGWVVNSLGDEPAAWSVLVRLGKQHPLSVYTGAIACIGAVVVAIVAWLLVRRRARATVAAGVVLVAGLVFAERSHIRPSSDVREYTTRAPVAAGIVDRYHVIRAYGAAPLAAIVVDSETARTNLTGDFGNPENAEVRTSDTPPSMGLLNYGADWDAVSRWWYRRELDSSGEKRAAVSRDFTDFHSTIQFWRPYRGSKGRLRLQGKLRPLADGRATCAFALPSDARKAEIGAPFEVKEVEIAWGTGRAKLGMATTSKNPFNPFAVIGDAVYREIVAQGGIVLVTVAAPVEHNNDTIWINTQR